MEGEKRRVTVTATKDFFPALCRARLDCRLVLECSATDEFKQAQ